MSELWNLALSKPAIAISNNIRNYNLELIIFRNRPKESYTKLRRLLYDSVSFVSFFYVDSWKFNL